MPTIRFRIVGRPAQTDGAVRRRVQLGHPLLPPPRMVRNDVHLAATRSCSSSAARTCRARARCCGPSASTRCWRWRARRCAPASLRCRRSRSARRCASRTRCRKGARASTRRSRASASSSDLAAGPRAAAVPARRAVPRHQFARSARRRRGRAAQPAGSRRHRPGHDARPRADRVADELRRAPPTSTSRTGSRATTCTFDYRMKPGPVTHSNALALMRAVGLDVPA